MWQTWGGHGGPPLQLLLRDHSLCRRARVTRQLEWVSFPILRPKYLNTGDFVVPDLSERRDYLLQRQNSESWQQTVTIFELCAWEIFGVVDVKDLDQVWIESLDHVER
jgi:hypothetical protein